MIPARALCMFSNSQSVTAHSASFLDPPCRDPQTPTDTYTLTTGVLCFYTCTLLEFSRFSSLLRFYFFIFFFIREKILLLGWKLELGNCALLARVVRAAGMKRRRRINSFFFCMCLCNESTTNKCCLDSRRRGSRGLRRAGDFSRVCLVSLQT